MCIHINHRYVSQGVPMSQRIQIVLSDEERSLFRSEAALAGLTLSEWIRRAARGWIAASRGRRRIDNAEQLEHFFTACDSREQGREADWSEHLRVIRESRAEGNPAP